MRMQFYYMGNPVDVPVWDLGDITDLYVEPEDAGRTVIDLKLSSGFNSVNSLCAGTSAVPGEALSPNEKINTSNSPLLPSIGSSYSLTFDSTPWQGVHDFKSTGGLAEDNVTINNYNITADAGNTVYLARAVVDGQEHLGYLIVNDINLESWGFIYNDTEDSTMDKIAGITPVELDPGDEGYEPTGAINQGKSIGGDVPGHGKRPQYKTDEIDLPDEPDASHASVANAGFLNVYNITQSNLNGVAACLYGDNIMAFIKNLALNPIDFIVSLNIFPYPPYLGSQENIKVGNWNCSTNAVSGLGANAIGYPLSNQFRTISFGSLTVNENWGNFLDYTHTSVQIFLPFIGLVDLDASEVIGATTTVEYTIDYFTGMCVANVKSTKNITVPTKGIPITVPQYAVHSYQGNCAIQVPVTSTSYGSMVGSLINAATSFVTAGPVGAGASLAGDIVSGNMGMKMTTKGTISANAGYCSVCYPYLLVTRPVPNIPASYQEVNGYPSYVDHTLGSCTGLCVCDNIKLQGISGATESEMNRIIQMCKEGVYV